MFKQRNTIKEKCGFSTTLFLLFFNAFLVLGQNESKSMPTIATITGIETNTSGRNTYSIAKIDYVIETGDTLSSQVQLYGLPFIGSFKKAGDTVEITYQKDNPYLVQTVSRGFIQENTWYILIGIALLFYGYRFIKRKKTAS